MKKNQRYKISRKFSFEIGIFAKGYLIFNVKNLILYIATDLDPELQNKAEFRNCLLLLLLYLVFSPSEASGPHSLYL